MFILYHCADENPSKFIKYVLKNPIKTATNEVITNVITIDLRTLPNLLGCFILPIDVDIVKNIKGTIIIINKLINKVHKLGKIQNKDIPDSTVIKLLIKQNKKLKLIYNY